MQLYPTLFLIAVGALKFTTSELINGTPPELANGDRPTRKLKKSGNSKKESTTELEKELNQYKKDLTQCVAMSEFNQENDGCDENFADLLSVSDMQAAEDLFYAEMTLDECTFEEIIKNGYEPCVNSFLSSYAPVITEVIQTAIPGSIKMDLGGAVSDRRNIGYCTLTLDAQASLNKVTGLNGIVVNQFTSTDISVPSSNPPLLTMDATIGAAVSLQSAGASGAGNARAHCTVKFFPDIDVSVGGPVRAKANAVGDVKMNGKFMVSTDTSELCLKATTKNVDIKRCNIFDVDLGFRLCLGSPLPCIPLGWLISNLFGPIMRIIAPNFCTGIAGKLTGVFKGAIDNALNKAGSCSIPECEGCLGICLKTGKLGRCE